jgi:hypothetical protein
MGFVGVAARVPSPWHRAQDLLPPAAPSPGLEEAAGRPWEHADIDAIEAPRTTMETIV